MIAGAPAIKAAAQFAKAGTAAQRASVVREIAIGLGLGMSCGLAFKVRSFSAVSFLVLSKARFFLVVAGPFGRVFVDVVEGATGRAKQGVRLSSVEEEKKEERTAAADIEKRQRL